MEVQRVVEGDHANLRVVGELGEQGPEDGARVGEESRAHAEARRLDEEEQGRAPRRPCHVLLGHEELANAAQQLRPLVDVAAHSVWAQVAKVLTRDLRR